MGFSNPPITWAEFERRLSGRAVPRPPEPEESPIPEPEQPAPERSSPTVPYAELHAHSNFSFLDGASDPTDLVAEAARLGLHALALTDHNGFYGSVRFAEAAETVPELGTVFGAELALPQSHLLLLAEGNAGYHRLSAAITHGQLAEGAEKGAPIFNLEEIAAAVADSAVVLTGCRRGAVRQALERGGVDAARTELDRLVALFGSDRVFVELTDQGRPEDSTRNDALAHLAAATGLPTIATTAAHYATPAQQPLGDAVAAIGARASLTTHRGNLPGGANAFLRSGAEMARRFRRYPGAVARTVPLATDLGMRLRGLRPGLPLPDAPAGHTPMSWLRELTWAGAARLTPNLPESSIRRIERELEVIEQKNFPGYFLIVWDIVQFARGRGILCQGRGSAANSMVCYLLEITAVDSISYGLPFERFLSSLREEEPDIDVDFDANRREEVIQYVYEKYGRLNAAQVANVISYRPKYAVRDTAKALGYAQGQQDALAKRVERSSRLPEDAEIPGDVRALASQLLTFPRHLGIHSGGMVLTDRPVGEVCPIEHARKDGRTVLQWDKDDCAWMGLVKFDLLGLGMLAAIQHCFDLVAEHCGETWTLHSLPKEEAGVYDQLCRADSIGVFQVESRAQMGMLPRLLPRRFYDLVIEVALVRPGPIQGGAVHPYIKRRTGAEPVDYLHPSLEPVLERTLGVPLFQEQLMQMAMAVGGCTAEDADLLRRAMGSKRGKVKIESLRVKLYAGMASNGITGEVADGIYTRIEAFASFGFAESHSISFALLVYASAWLRLHYPAAFLAALLRSQPMGFYSGQTLVADARRHGVTVLGPDLHRSAATSGVELRDPAITGPTGMSACACAEQPPVGPFDPAAPIRDAEHRRDGHHVVRLGLEEITGIGPLVAVRIVAERERGGRFLDLGDLARRTGLTSAQLEALASSGACGDLGVDRRQALWQSGPASRERPDQLSGSAITVQPPLFAMMDDTETLIADLATTGISPADHIIRPMRPALESAGILAAASLRAGESGRRIRVAGVVTHRQRPATASGITFVSLEDETGLVNVICSVGVWKRYARVARESPGLIVRGILERSPEGIVNVVADRLDPLGGGIRPSSRDFQ